jgi:hypothetical protein
MLQWEVLPILPLRQLSQSRRYRTTLAPSSNVAYDMPAKDPADKPHENAAPFKREPVPDLPRKLPTGSSGMEPAVATGFCGLMLDAGAWAFARDKSGDFFPALTPICMVAGVIVTTISVVLFGLVWIRHRRGVRSN